METSDIRILQFGETLYDRAKVFRETMLRIPFGLRLTEKDLEGEESQIHIVAVDQSDDILGTVILKPIARHGVILRQMAVADKRQGTGLGRKLVIFAEETVKQKGFSDIELEARASASGFYKRLGYVSKGDTYIKFTIPHIRMRKSL